MKISTSKTHYGNDIIALIERESETGPVNRSQSRPRIVLLLGLISILILLVMIANAFAPAAHISIGSEYTLSKVVSQQTIEGPYNRNIHIVEYQDYSEEDEEYQDDYEEDEENDTDNNSHDDNFKKEWSKDQIEEMKRYYKRYLEVFFEKNGHGHEPEDMEFVYSEYLKFKERKARQRSEKEKQKEQPRIIRSSSISQENHSTTTDAEEDVEEDQHDGTRSLDSYEIRPSQYPDNTIVKQDPYYLEMEWEDFNEVGGDNFGSSNNYTATLTIDSVSNTVVVVDRASINDDSPTQQPLSGRGRMYAV